LDELLLAFSPRATTSSTLNLGDVIEIQGAPSTSKSTLLYFFCMTTLLPYSMTLPLKMRGSSLPPRDERIDMGGRGTSAVLFDTDNKFSVAALERMLTAHILKRISAHCKTVPQLYNASVAPEAVREQVLLALSHLHIFKPTSTVALAASLKTLSSHLLEVAPTENVNLLIVDSMSAFYHQDRFASEQSGGQAPHPMRHVMNALAEVRSTIAPLIVLSNWGLSPLPPDRQGRPSPFFRQHLASPYPAPYAEGSSIPIPFDPVRPLKRPANLPLNLTHHLTLHSPAPAPYPAGTTLKQVMVDLARRSTAPTKTVEVHLRLPGAPGGAGANTAVGTLEYRLRDGQLEA
jgi:DNA-repair protein XRCC2